MSRFDELVAAETNQKKGGSLSWYERLSPEGREEMDEFRRQWDSGRWVANGMYAVSKAGAAIVAGYGIKVGRDAISRWLRRVKQ